MMIELDGSTGEGGGQILRSALTLSMINGRAFRITDIRANRPKPGLMRQHLVAVQAAARISNAKVEGAELGSSMLVFEPGKVVAGDYTFAIGSAGSCTLVLQTLILALLYADGPSTVRITGGTHNPMAPPAQFLQRAYCPLLEKMGASVGIDLIRSGFYPAGGGELVATIKPCRKLSPLFLLERGKQSDAYAESFVAAVPGSVAQRELQRVGEEMGWDADRLRIRGLPADQGPGNALLITLVHEHVGEVFAAFGEKGVSAEKVADAVLTEARRYLDSGAAVGEHLADQLMLPLALAGGGEFTADVLSGHAVTNAAVISRFLPVAMTLEHGVMRSTCTVRTTA